MFCRQQVAELANHETQFADKQAILAVIGNGDAKHLEPFRQATGYRGVLLTDPSRASFESLAFHNSLGKTVTLGAVGRAFSALKQGYRPGNLQGSASQLGGAIVIDPQGQVRYYFQAAEAGSHPPVAELLGAVG